MHNYNSIFRFERERKAINNSSMLNRYISSLIIINKNLITGKPPVFIKKKGKINILVSPVPMDSSSTIKY